MKKTNEDKALEIYLKLGPKRTYRQVSDQLGEKYDTIDRWGRKNKWVSKAKEYDADVHNKTVAILKSEDIDIRTKLYKAMNSTLDVYMDNLTKGEIAVNAVQVLEQIGMLYSQLEAPTVQKDNIQGSVQGVKFSLDITKSPADYADVDEIDEDTDEE